MSTADLARVVALAAIWGAAFMFFRIASPSLGAVLTVEIRVSVAAVLLGLYAAWHRVPIDLVRHWRPFVAVGAFSSAIPFTLFAFAAAHVPAGVNSIMNGTSPLFGAVIAAVALRDPLTLWRACALLLGFGGILVLVGDPSISTGPMTYWAILAGLVGGFCYALAGVITKRTAAGVAPLAMSAGTQIAATVLLAPLLPLMPTPGPVTHAALAAAVALGVLCSGVGYVLYFQLIRNVGPVRTLLVTFLIPVFGVLWGAIFLGERITAQTVLGGLIVLVAIWMETRPRRSAA